MKVNVMVGIITIYLVIILNNTITYGQLKVIYIVYET